MTRRAVRMYNAARSMQRSVPISLEKITHDMKQPCRVCRKTIEANEERWGKTLFPEDGVSHIACKWYQEGE